MTCGCTPYAIRGTFEPETLAQNGGKFMGSFAAAPTVFLHGNHDTYMGAALAPLPVPDSGRPEDCHATSESG
jgi:hypothetical protein